MTKERFIELANIFHSLEFSGNPERNEWLRKNMNMSYGTFYSRKKKFEVKTTVVMK